MITRITEEKAALDKFYHIPLIEIDRAELNDDRYDHEVVQVDITDGEKKSRYWLTLRVVKGRPELIVRTKIGKERTQREKRIQGSFNIESRPVSQMEM